MNFKPNAWTLLFAIAAAIALYFCTCKCDHTLADPIEIVEDKKPNKCKDLPPPDYQMSDSLAQTWIERYRVYAQKIVPQVKIINPDVIYFTLPRCEMEEMIEDLGPDTDVKAHLAINDEGMIVLVFQDIQFSRETDLSGGSGFFDFTRPCPTYCGED